LIKERKIYDQNIILKNFFQITKEKTTEKKKEKENGFIECLFLVIEINIITHNLDNNLDFQYHRHLVNHHHLNYLIDVLKIFLDVFYLIYVLLHDDFETIF
jgi:hypothetical protein